MTVLLFPESCKVPYWRNEEPKTENPKEMIRGRDKHNEGYIIYI